MILLKNIHNKSQYYIFLLQKMKNFSLSLPRGVCSSILLRRPSASTSFLPRKSAGTRCTNPVHYHTVSTVRHFLPPDQQKFSRDNFLLPFSPSLSKFRIPPLSRGRLANRPEKRRKMKESRNRPFLSPQSSLKSRSTNHRFYER